MSPLADLTIEERDGVAVAALAGEVDLSNAVEVGSAIEAAVENAAAGLVLDLSGTAYLDSSGIQLVFELARRLGRRQQCLRVVVPSEASIRRALELADVGAVVPIVGEVETAVERVRAECGGPVDEADSDVS